MAVNGCETVLVNLWRDFKKSLINNFNRVRGDKQLCVQTDYSRLQAMLVLINSIKVSIQYCSLIICKIVLLVGMAGCSTIFMTRERLARID